MEELWSFKWSGSGRAQFFFYENTDCVIIISFLIYRSEGQYQFIWQSSVSLTDGFCSNSLNISESNIIFSMPIGIGFEYRKLIAHFDDKYARFVHFISALYYCIPFE